MNRQGTRENVETVVRVRGSDTDGAYAVVEQPHPVGRGAPMHFHRVETETLLVLDGKYVAVVDGKPHRLTAGQSVTVAPGIPHAFANKGNEPGRLLIVAFPAGIEEYLMALEGLDWDSPDAFEQLQDLEARFGIVTPQPE